MHTLTDISLSMWAKELTKKFFVCLCKCKNKSTLYSPSHPPTHICIYSHTHTQVDLHSKGPAPSKWIAGPIDFFFPSARPRPVSLFDLVGCYPAKPPPPHTHTHRISIKAALLLWLIVLDLCGLWASSLPTHTLPPPCVHIRAINSPPSVLHCAENQWC